MAQTSRSYCVLPPVGQYKKLSEGTKEDFKLSQIHFAKHGSPEAIANRLLGKFIHSLTKYVSKIKSNPIKNIKSEC